MKTGPFVGPGGVLPENRSSLDTPAVRPGQQSNEIIFVRREECRKCDGSVWALYYFTPAGVEAGWGAIPIGQCGNSSRCGEKLQGLDDDDLILARCRMGGAA